MFKNIYKYLVCIVFFFVSFISGLESGASCKINGRCVPARECLPAKERYIKNRTIPIICSYDKEVHICCETDNAINSGAANTRSNTDGCEPVTPVTAPEVGQKSWNKCLEYQENIMRPCTHIIQVEDKLRSSQCNRDSLALIPENGVYEDEFPHIVLLGYGDDVSSLRWLCEGVIISERFILSIALCSCHKEHGAVKYIRTGVLNASDAVDASRVFKIKRIIMHPLYQFSKPDYNIALLEIDNDIPLDLSAIPACIDVGNLPTYTHALTIGWDNKDIEKGILQKRHLFETVSSDCNSHDHIYLNRNTTQMCYDNKYEKLNYYGFEHILQIEHIKCMYVVIGLELRHCRNYAGVPFTKVSEYVPWIESIVWP